MNMMRYIIAIVICITLMEVTMSEAKTSTYKGQFIRGTGDAEYLQLIDTSFRMFNEDPDLPNISMMYTPIWNGLYEGATWDAWWIQNSYGASYCSLPFLKEPYLSFLMNANDLWFNMIGDGKRKGYSGIVGPDGCLCDAARLGEIFYKQGDGMVDKHDYAVEFTAAGIVIQSEMLLIRRDMEIIDHYLPLLERCEAFLNSRRDPENDLFLAGMAGNLLGPSWTGTQYPDGSFDMGYLSGLSITYIAALDRLIELEKMAGNAEKVKLYEVRRYRARKALDKLMTDDGYFIKGIDKLGDKHGVYGAQKYGYFESSVNHDAVAFGVVDKARSKKIIDKMASIPGLRPYSLIIANYPALDDMADHDFGFGQWVNGGHWSTCEARMIMAYYRVGRYNDVKNSMNQIMKFFNDYKIDNPLTNFGSEVWFKDRITTIIYDGFGIPAALIRGLFQPAYYADRMTLTPSIPDGINSLDQQVPLRFGLKQVYLSVKRANVPSMEASVNGKAWTKIDGDTIVLPYNEINDKCHVEIKLPESKLKSNDSNKADYQVETKSKAVKISDIHDEFDSALAALRDIKPSKTRSEYEAGFIKATEDAIKAYRVRVQNDREGKYSGLSDEKRKAIIELYRKAADDMLSGLRKYTDTIKISD